MKTPRQDAPLIKSATEKLTFAEIWAVRRQGYRRARTHLGKDYGALKGYFDSVVAQRNQLESDLSVARCHARELAERLRELDPTAPALSAFEHWDKTK